MLTEIIIIGNELVTGKTRDLNGWYASGRLLSSGLEVSEIRTVGDDYDTLSAVLKAATKRSRFIIVTGGLGPTEDDLTAEIASKALDIPLCLDRSLLDHIKSYVKKLGIAWSPSLEKLAWLPKDAKILDPHKAMCGFALSKDKSLFYFLPGVPDQMRYLMNEVVIPDILRKYQPTTLPRHRLLKVFGLNESSIADIFKDLSLELQKVVFGFYPSFPENHITITVKGKDEEEIEKELDKAEKHVRSLLGPYIFGSEGQSMESVVGDLLSKQNLTLSVAESCTGGLIGHRITSIAGSSLYFERGFIVYSNRSKIEMLGVDQKTLDAFGAVSEQTVRQMAEGTRRHAKTDLGLAVTGTAGPLGGTEEKPVGTVYIGLSVSNKTFSSQYRFTGDRAKIKLIASEMALDWVRRYLNEHPFIPGI